MSLLVLTGAMGMAPFGVSSSSSPEIVESSDCEKQESKKKKKNLEQLTKATYPKSGSNTNRPSLAPIVERVTSSDSQKTYQDITASQNHSRKNGTSRQMQEPVILEREWLQWLAQHQHQQRSSPIQNV